MEQKIFYPKDLMAYTGWHRNTLRSLMKAGKVPKFDVDMNWKHRYWHKQTLIDAGIIKDGD